LEVRKVYLKQEARLKEKEMGMKMKAWVLGFGGKLGQVLVKRKVGVRYRFKPLSEKE